MAARLFALLGCALCFAGSAGSFLIVIDFVRGSI